MPRKAVKVYLSRQQLRFLEKVTGDLGMDYSGFFQMLLIQYLDDHNLIMERYHSGQEIPKRRSHV